MEKYIDIALTKTEKGYYDISFEKGDFKKIAGYDTAILMSLLAERRATESEVEEPQRRRGWVGNEINGYDAFEYGSKFWLLDQARATQSTLNDSVTYVQDGLQWKIDDTLTKSINVNSEYDKHLHLIINIDFIRFGDKTLSATYNAWENTFTTREV